MLKGGYNVNPLAIGDIFWAFSGNASQKLFRVAGGVDDNYRWLVITFITIIGFLAYRVLIDSWLRTENFVSGPAKVALDDTLRWTTILAVVYLGLGGSIFDQAFFYSVLSVVGPLVLYDFLLNDFVIEKTKELEPNVAKAIQDVAKYGLSFTAGALLLNGGNALDSRFLISIAGWLTGIALYDLFLEKHLIGDSGIYSRYIRSQ
jgi:hypothetical protein